MVYADTSFITPVYVHDTRSPETIKRLSSLPSIWITPLNRAELAHALELNVFWAKLSAFEANRAWNRFESDLTKGVWIGAVMPDLVWNTSIDLARRYSAKMGVRTLDTLHVASALELKAEQFWTFDERQAKLADAVGLDTRA